MWERIEYQFEELNIPSDIVKAVVETKNDTIINLFERAKAFKKLSKSKDFKKVAFTFKRVNNIVYKAEEKFKKDNFDSIDESFFEEEEEKNLYKEWKKHYKKLQTFEKNKNYKKFFDIIVQFKPIVDEFFDNVMVMAENKTLRTNRLALLKDISNFFNKVVKFEHIVVN
jgi:glycyl-tRNA synthetase beta chain